MVPKIARQQHRNSNRETRDPQTVLPSSLLEELPTTTSTSASGLRPDGPGRTYTTTTRKQARKQKRIEKKQIKVVAQREWITRRKAYTADSRTKPQPQTTSGSVKEQETSGPFSDTIDAESGGVGDAASQDVPVEGGSDDAAGTLKDPLKRKRKDSLKSSAQRAEDETNPIDDPDAKRAKELEVLLGIDRKRRKRESSGHSFTYEDIFGEGEEDLVDLLQFCDGVQSKSTQPQHPSGASDSVRKRDVSDSSHSQEEVSSSYDGEGSEEEDNESVQGSDDESADESSYSDDVRKVSEGEDLQNGHNASHSSDATARGKESTNSFTAVDGSPALNNVAPNLFDSEHMNEGPSTRDSSIRKVGKYLPPSARKRNDKLADGMKRRLRGLLNRVADVNASGIADSLVQLFRSADNGLSLRELSNLYANAALDSSRDGSGVAQVNPYVQSHAAIAAHLGKQVDLIILATLLVSAVRRMVSSLESSDLARSHGLQSESDIAAFEESRGECFGYVALLCALYTRGALSSRVIYEIVKFVANSLSGVRLEILLFMLRQMGAQLRLDDPAGLKDVIEFIYDRFAALRDTNAPSSSNGNPGENSSDTKIQIMLDLVNDIKNNKLRKSAVIEAQAKFSWASVPDDPLTASLNDLRDDDFIKLRWWDDTKGLTIAERRGETPIAQPKDEAAFSNFAEEGPDLATLASTLRLNTEYRRALFRAIMGSANVKDAFERLENMGAFTAKASHDRDTALVILHCCGSEKEFNPFYAVLAEKVCQRARRLRFTFEFALWDVFKAIPGSSKVAAMAKRKRSNYAQLLTYLWMSGALSMSVLRCVPDFEECGALEKEFFTDTVAQLMRKLSSEEKDRLAPFEKLSKESWNGVDDFRTSFALFLRRSVGPCLTGRERALQTQAIDLLEKGQAVNS